MGLPPLSRVLRFQKPVPVHPDSTSNPSVKLYRSAVAVNVVFAGLNVTPAGASPPALGVAITVLVPGIGPIVQQTPALPFTSVDVAAVDPKVAPHTSEPEVSGEMVPPPRPTVHDTGTFVSTVPSAVLIETPGRHSGSSGSPNTAETAVHTPPTTMSRRDPGAASRPLVAGAAAAAGAVSGLEPRGRARVIWNSPAVPPTPPEKLSSGSMMSKGLNSPAVPPTPPPKNLVVRA